MTCSESRIFCVSSATSFLLCAPPVELAPAPIEQLGRFHPPQCVAVLSDLGPVPRDPTVTIRCHRTLLSRAECSQARFRFATFSSPADHDELVRLVGLP